MKRVYQNEQPDFIETIDAKCECPCYALPQEMIAAIEALRRCFDI